MGGEEETEQALSANKFLLAFAHLPPLNDLIKAKTATAEHTHLETD